jgi:hypothetical protein
VGCIAAAPGYVVVSLYVELARLRAGLESLLPPSKRQPWRFLLDDVLDHVIEHDREARTGVGARFIRSSQNFSISAWTPTRLLRLSKNLPHDWKEQRRFLGFAA